MIPNFGEKYDAPAVLSPREAVGAQGDGLPDVPPAVILGFQSGVTEAVRERAGEPVELVRSQRVLPVTDGVGYVPVHEAGIGAPVAATVTENAIAAEAEVVVLLGGCAGIDPSVAPDAAILPTESIRDEGVSYHYVPPEKSVSATGSLVDALDDSLSAAGFDTPRGRTWTTSAMYRETIPEVERYREEGVVSLCMESAAIWSVCAYRGVATATVHWMGDFLGTEEWLPDTDTDSDRAMTDLIDPTVRALDDYVA